MTHPTYTHPDGHQCIWVHGYWFTPFDAGGEGEECKRWHPTDYEREKMVTWIESGIRLISPDHITPIGARQLRAILDKAME